jgi:hypothetical protein
MLLIDEIKIALRISATNYAFDDGEIDPLMEAARQELMLSGISSEILQKEKEALELDSDLDPLIKRAITIYCKAQFGFDNPDSEKLMNSFEMLKSHMSLSGDYNAIP